MYVKHGSGPSHFGVVLKLMVQGTVYWQGRIDSIESIQFNFQFEAKVVPFVKRLRLKTGCLPQMDKDPKYTSKSTMDVLKRRKVIVLPWPLQSPDLNVIENLSIDLNKEVQAAQESLTWKTFVRNNGQKSLKQDKRTLGQLQKALKAIYKHLKDTCQRGCCQVLGPFYFCYFETIKEILKKQNKTKFYYFYH